MSLLLCGQKNLSLTFSKVLLTPKCAAVLWACKCSKICSLMILGATMQFLGRDGLCLWCHDLYNMPSLSIRVRHMAHKHLISTGWPISSFCLGRVPCSNHSMALLRMGSALCQVCISCWLQVSIQLLGTLGWELVSTLSLTVLVLRSLSSLSLSVST